MYLVSSYRNIDVNVKGGVSCQEGCEQKQSRPHNLDKVLSASKIVQKKSIYIALCNCRGNPSWLCAPRSGIAMLAGALPRLSVYFSVKATSLYKAPC